MIVKDIVYEDFSNYKRVAMFIGTAYCDWKCCIDFSYPITICQNSSLASLPSIEIPTETIISRYLQNPLTHAIVFGGLEPFEQYEEICEFLELLRNKYHCNDEVVIYSGYELEELCEKYDNLQVIVPYGNIILKTGRYNPNQPNQLEEYDEVLGVKLASNNQKGMRLC